MKKNIELHTKCIRQLTRIEILNRQIADFEKRIEIEMGKDLIERWLLISEKWLKDKIEECHFKILIREMFYNEAINELKKLSDERN